MSTTAPSLGDTLRRLRTSRRMTQADLARAAKTSVSHISRIESGKRLELSRDLLGRLGRCPRRRPRARAGRGAPSGGRGAGGGSSLGSDWHGDARAPDALIDARPQPARPKAGRRCDDLLHLLIPLRSDGPVDLRGRILEIKYRDSTDPNAASCAREQLELTREWLLEKFNGTGSASLFRARDLAEPIRGAATRATAFGLVTIDDRPGFEQSRPHRGGPIFAESRVRRGRLAAHSVSATSAKMNQTCRPSHR